MSDPTFYVASISFGANRSGPRTVLLEGLHPAVYALVFPHALEAGEQLSLAHWSELSLEQASGLWEAFEAAGQGSAIVTIDGIHDELVESVSRSEGAPKRLDAYARKLSAIRAYAAGIGHEFEEPSAPKP